LNLDELAKKDSSKDKALTHTQRIRFETIFPNYHERFRPRVAAGTTTQTVIPPSTTNNETTTIGGSSGDNNLPRMYLSYFHNTIKFIFHIIGKEERTPSDSQSNASERPMIEVKKQKTQK
jgi:hypothetical protein